jgi:small-conductance mechanosensitive channel
MFKSLLCSRAAAYLLMAPLLPTAAHAAAPSISAALTNAPSTNAPAATPPQLVAPGDVVTAVQDATTKLQEGQRQISPDTLAASLRDGLAATTRAIDRRLEIDRHYAQSSPSLGNLQNAQSAWQDISDAIAGTQKVLSNRVGQQRDLLTELTDMKSTWKATLESEEKSNAPAAMVQSIQQLQGQIDDTIATLNADLKDLYALQVSFAQQADRAKAGLDTINKEILAAQARLFEQNQPALWDSAAFSSNEGMVGLERVSLHDQASHVREYLAPRIGSILIQAFLLAILIATFYWIRNVVTESAKTDIALSDAERVFSTPLATALLLALVACNWLYPVEEAPRLLWSIIGAIALFPTVVIVRRLVSPALLPLLYATVIAYFIDQVRNAATRDGAFARYVLLAEMIAACLFILGALRSKKLAAAEARIHHEKLVRGYLHVAFFVFLAAGVANLLGYGQIAQLIGNGMLDSSYLAVIFYAAVRVIDAVLLALMSVRPISSFGTVRHHHDLVYATSASLIRWIATAAWALIALQLFSLRNPLWDWSSAFLTTEHSFFSIKYDLGSILAFPITVWVAFALSRFIRFALEEDVYPNLNLPRGIPYAISTLVHYSILVFGFFLALSAMGINLSNYAVLAGAFGVGLGFGLQNIMNNFISGLILLFERPVKVGDTIQIDATTIGRVERIGIRASVILLTNGSELIVPNGNLISNPVTNWTLSNCERLIEVPISIAAKANAKRALELLIESARANSAVLKNPPPQAVILSLAAASTALRLRCWIDSEEDWMKVTSEITLALQAALEKEEIALA